MKSANSQAAGIAKLPSCPSSFAVTQSAWRFFSNDRVSLHDLIEPIRDAGVKAASGSQSNFALAVHDWSKIRCGRHRSKKDLAQLTHENDIGYELFSCLLVDAGTGIPLAPMEFRLETATEIHHTQEPQFVEEVWHGDQIGSVMTSARSWGVDRTIVHVVDQEGDSIGHFRQWSDQGETFLVRSQDRRVTWRGETRKFSSIVRTLLREDAFETGQAIEFRGRQHELRVAETEVILHRPSQPRVAGKQTWVHGEPLPLRLIVSRVYDKKNRKKAEWYLLTNAPPEADKFQVADWYYWRWRIESFFKLLKSSGFELERWQQESGSAIAKRLLVAAMACVVIWQLERDNSDDAKEMKTLLVTLSGRQMKRSRPFTAPAMLAGLEKLIPMLQILETKSIAELRSLANKTLPAQILNSS